MKATAGCGVSLAAVMMLLLSGCTSDGSTDRQESSPTTRSGGGPPWWPSVPRGSEGSFTTATVPASGATTTSAPTARPCRASDLRVTGGASVGAGGTRHTGLGFTNRSSTPCTLAGHPKASFLDRSGRVLGQALPTPGPETVTVSPGQYATTALGVGSMRLGACEPVTPAALRIVLPGGGLVSVPAGDFTFCLGEIASVRHFSGPFTD